MMKISGRTRCEAAADKQARRGCQPSNCFQQRYQGTYVPCSPGQFVQSGRRGLTLLEVLISVAIFLGALTAIMQLLNTGQQSEVSARLKTEAVLRCEAKMAEIVSGIEEATSSDEQKFPDDEIGHWQWSAEVGNGSATSLLMITVTVEHLPDGKNPNASFTLTRYMRDPQLFIDAALSEVGK